MVAIDAFGEHLGVFRELTSGEGRSWLSSLPAVVAALEDEWDLRTGSLLETLPDGDPPVLLHGDLNPGNILSATRAPFLAIDAKPMIGDAAYDPPQLLTQIHDRAGEEDTATTMRARFAAFAGLVEVPADRMLAWGVARSVEGALWDVVEGHLANGERAMRTARMLADAGGLQGERR